MTYPYAADNTAQRERLIALVNRLSDSDMSRTVEHGWTVATVLVHLAFWDRHRWMVLNQWRKDGQLPALAPDPVNDVVAILSAAIPPRAAARLAVEAAETLDRELEQLTPEQVTALEAAGMNRLLNRSLHRKDHLDQIEQVFS